MSRRRDNQWIGDPSTQEERVSSSQFDAAFEKFGIQCVRENFAIKTTEAPHFRRFVLQRIGDPLAGPVGGETSRRIDRRNPVAARAERESCSLAMFG